MKIKITLITLFLAISTFILFNKNNNKIYKPKYISNIFSEAKSDFITHPIPVNHLQYYLDKLLPKNKYNIDNYSTNHIKYIQGNIKKTLYECTFMYNLNYKKSNVKLIFINIKLKNKYISNKIIIKYNKSLATILISNNSKIKNIFNLYKYRILSIDIPDQSNTMSHTKNAGNTDNNHQHLIIGTSVMIIILFAILGFQVQRKRQLIKEIQELKDKEGKLKDLLSQNKKNKHKKMKILVHDKIEFAQIVSSLNCAEYPDIKLINKIKKIIHEKGIDNMDQDILLDLLNALHDNHLSYMKECFPKMKRDELLLCGLFKSQFSTKEISSIMNVAPETIKKRKYRIKKYYLNATGYDPFQLEHENLFKILQNEKPDVPEQKRKEK